MKKILIVLLSVLFVGTNLMVAQPGNAGKILDNTARVLNNKGVKASFSITGSLSTNGSIQLKGNKFILATGKTNTWFDGRTQWSYVKSNQEVNVSTPTTKQIQNLNPYTYINCYRTEFNSKYNGISGGNYSVMLLPKNSRMGIRNVTLFISKNYQPRKIVITQSNGSRQTVIIKSFQSGLNYNDAMFKFNQKKYPKAEIIDLR